MTQPNPQEWIGRSEVCDDNIDPGHVQKIALALDGPVPAAGDSLPHLWHWALFISSAPYAELGSDGHPRRGGFLPPADRRNRMWAGGRLSFHAPLRVGLDGQRRSTIANVVEKQGRTGKLLFVTVRHEIFQEGRICIDEEQDIVYREPSPPKLTGTEAAPEAQWSETVKADPVMLFRYSAVTFNGHRIHYDMPYATEVEGYPGLVIHGPMIATLMCGAFQRAHPDKVVTRFSYRGLRPLTTPEAFQVAGRMTEEGQARLWAERDGTLAHQAEIGFKP